MNHTNKRTLPVDLCFFTRVSWVFFCQVLLDIFFIFFLLKHQRNHWVLKTPLIGTIHPLIVLRNQYATHHSGGTLMFSVWCVKNALAFIRSGHCWTFVKQNFRPCQSTSPFHLKSKHPSIGPSHCQINSL